MKYIILLVYVLCVVLVWVTTMKKKRSLKQSKERDLSSPQKLQELINKWRKIIGVDPVYIINLKIGITENPALIDHPAWIDGLSTETKHPAVDLYINAAWLDSNRTNEYEINLYIIHELCHIIVFDAFIMANPEYKYEGLQARANETLTMKIASAIMQIYLNK